MIFASEGVREQLMTREISNLEGKVEILLWIFRTQQTALEDTPSGALARALAHAHKIERPMNELGAIVGGFSLNLWQFMGTGGKVLDWRPSLSASDVRRAVAKQLRAEFENNEARLSMGSEETADPPVSQCCQSPGFKRHCVKCRTQPVVIHIQTRHLGYFCAECCPVCRMKKKPSGV